MLVGEARVSLVMRNAHPPKETDNPIQCDWHRYERCFHSLVVVEAVQVSTSYIYKQFHLYVASNACLLVVQ